MRKFIRILLFNFATESEMLKNEQGRYPFWDSLRTY